jgi:hypothetical protein
MKTLPELIEELAQEKEVALADNQNIVGFATQGARESFALSLITLRRAKGFSQLDLAEAAGVDMLFIQVLEGCFLTAFIGNHYVKLVAALECNEKELQISDAFWLHED